MKKANLLKGMDLPRLHGTINTLPNRLDHDKFNRDDTVLNIVEEISAALCLTPLVCCAIIQFDDQDIR